MARTSNISIFQNTRLFVIYSLVFFLWAVLPGCMPKQVTPVQIIQEGGRAVGLRIAIADVTHVERVEDKAHTHILGSFEEDGNTVIFRPVVPLSAGLTYTVWQGSKELYKVSIPSPVKNPVELTAIYPEADTLPENLLKMYFEFSKPMRAGQSLDGIKILNSKGETMNDVFLNLQPELWDTSGRILTLWLDPGRIKHDLLRNRQLGNPLKQGEQYTVTVSQNWEGIGGFSLARSYKKVFVAGKRDDAVPDINSWKLDIPKPNTQEPLVITFTRPLDHFLLAEMLSVANSTKQDLYGDIQVSNNDRTLKFIPAKPWQAATYTLQADALLEDLAGNNLNKLFDRDIKKDARRDQVIYERKFVIK